MCFSPEADIVAGIVVSGVGIDALRHVRETKEYPLAALPLLLGAHLLVETYVWWDQVDRVPAYVGHAAVWLYLAIALGVLPVLVPVAIFAVEPDPRRRRWLMPFMAVGAGLAALLMAVVITGPVSATIQGCCLAYDPGPGYIGVFGALYVLVTCIPMLVSSHRHMVAFGVVNLIAVSLIAWLLASGLASLWCAWAAVTSLLIARHLRHADRSRSPQPTVVSDMSAG
ncbi:MAG: hypothetical protein OEM84_04495 [Acidimicrobiia bacterium]|nr:hypothetical protein [Acidimicrobiia bacterium]